MPAHGPLMLMYHSISTAGKVPDWPWAVSIEHFRAQLDFLAEAGYATPTMGELVANPQSFRGRRTVTITFDDGYQDNLAAFEELKRRNMLATWFIVSGSVGRVPTWPADGRPAGRLLNAGELRQMRDAGMEIGSHTVNHLRLTELDEASRRNELLSSKQALEDILGNSVTSFAYPYGAWDEGCATAAREADYLAACTTRTGWALRDGDPYRLRRLTVFNADLPGHVVRKLAYGTHDIGWSKLLRYHSGMLVRRLAP